MMDFQRLRCQESGSQPRGGEPRRGSGRGTPVALDVGTMLRRALPLLLCLLALLGGAAPAQAAKAADADADGDLAAQATEILSLERLARHSEDVQLRDAAHRQIDRLESRARARAAEELGRDFFRERAAGKGLEGRERESGPRDVRVFGGREVVRPPQAFGRDGRNGDDRGRGRGNERLGDERGGGRSGRDGDDRGGDARDGDDRGDDGRDDVRDDVRDEPDDAADNEHDVSTDDDDNEMDRSELEFGDDRE